MSNRTEQKVALVFGASGLVGSELVKELINDESYSTVKVFTRKQLGYADPKVNEQVIDFTRLDKYAHLVTGHDLFICLGTTIRTAGSVKKMEEIDRDLPVAISQIAHANGVARAAVVSSLGANVTSGNYYLRIKGEMEAGIRKILFDQTIIVRPSMLFGERKERRFGELIGKVFMNAIGFLLVGSSRKYRGIEGNTVVLAMISLIKSSRREIVYLSDELQKFSRK